MNWEMIGLILAVVAALILGGYVAKVTKEVGEAHNALWTLITYVKNAMQDRNLTDEERLGISLRIAEVEKEFKDVANLAREIAVVIARRGK